MNSKGIWRQAAVAARGLVAPLVAAPTNARATAADAAALAQKTLNPIADLVSLPSSTTTTPTRRGGRRHKSLLNIQPVVPISIGRDWNLVSRTIIPLIDQNDIVPGGAADASGLGDIVESLFFSPKQPTAGGWVWGVGPVFLLPTASDDVLGTGKWGVGPTFVGLKQANGWTFGMLANHIWSVRETTIALTSTPPSCSRGSPTPRKRSPPFPSTPSPRTTGLGSSGRCRCT
jgi:hypothetical protein